MEMLCAILLSLLLCQQGSALRGISEAEFAKFPLMNHFDRYAECVAEPGGAFCVAGAMIVADQPSELYDKMMNFSFSSPIHFDYRKIRRGYCMTRRCKEFRTGDSEVALQATLGACLNSTLQREYGLRARIERVTCYRHGHRHNFTLLDSAAAVLFISLIGLTVSGTLYDMFATKKDKKGYLMCFSIPANWAKLVAPWPQGPTTARLIGVNGLRLFTSLATTFIHALIPLPHIVANMYRVEEVMEEAFFHFQANAHIIIQTFIFLSGLFLAYTAQAAAERSSLTWGSLPKAVLLRWLRLAPVYLLVVLYTVTLFKYIPFGPMWQDYIGDEAHDCQRDWLSMVFFYNNYVYGSQCNHHQWSTAVDMQLHVVGLTVMLLPQATRASVLGVLIAAGVAAPGLETYFRDLDGAVVSGGKIVYNQKSFDAGQSFNILQKRTHTNMASFFMGMAFGLFLYKWMKKPTDNNKYKKYWWVHWATLPSCLLIVYSHRYLYTEGERRSLAVRVLYAMFPRPIWSGIICLSVFGMVCQLENGLHRLMSWHGWVPLTRLTFCVHNVHMLVLRSLHATDTQLFHASELAVIIRGIGYLIISFALAVPTWLVVETPIDNVVRKLFPEKISILEVNTAPSKTE